MARRRGYLLSHDGADENSFSGSGNTGCGAFDRLVGIFWPHEKSRSHRLHGRASRRLGRLLLDTVTFLICLLALLILSVIFLSLVVCVPLTLITVTTPVSSSGSVLTGVCVRVLNIFGLQVLLAVWGLLIKVLFYITFIFSLPVINLTGECVCRKIEAKLFSSLFHFAGILFSIYSERSFDRLANGLIAPFLLGQSIAEKWINFRLENQKPTRCLFSKIFFQAMIVQKYLS